MAYRTYSLFGIFLCLTLNAVSKESVDSKLALSASLLAEGPAVVFTPEKVCWIAKLCDVSQTYSSNWRIWKNRIMQCLPLSSCFPFLSRILEIGMISFCKRQASKCQTFAPLTALGNTSARHVALAPSMCLSCKDAFECISHTEWSKRRVCLWPTSFSPIQQTEDLNSVVTHINGRKHREKSRLAIQPCQNSCLFASACLVA